MNSNTRTLDSVRNYYGRVLKTNQDLKTSVCCAGASLPSPIREILKDIHPDVLVPDRCRSDDVEVDNR